MTEARRTSSVARRRSDAANGVVWHAAFALAVAATLGGLAYQGLAPVGPEMAALAAGGAAAILGALLSLAGGVGRTLAVLVWGLAGAAACHLTGGTAGPLSAWCLAPAAAATVFKSRDLLALGAAASLAAAAVSALTPPSCPCRPPGRPGGRGSACWRFRASPSASRPG